MVRGGDIDEDYDDSEGEGSYDELSSDDESEGEESMDEEEESTDEEEEEADAADESVEEESTDAEDGSTDEEDAADVEILDEDGNAIVDAEKVARAEKYAALSSQSRNFGIATALWGSLFFDTVLNKAKRADVFPAMLSAGSSTSTLVPTALLASGFFLAGGTSFLLWRDADNRAEALASDDGTSSKGDWFLALPSKNSDDKEFASRTRARLSLHLSLFGILNLAAHGGYYFSDRAPYLGTSAAIINVHNTLACASGLLKEYEGGIKELAMKAIKWPVSLFRGTKEESRGRTGLTLFLFRLGAIASWLQCVPIVVYMVGSISLLQSSALASEPLAVASRARTLSLSVASLARHTLLAGMAHTLSTTVKQSDEDNAIDGADRPFFAVLSGILGTACLAVVGTLLFESCTSKAGLVSEIIAKGALPGLFGILAGYRSVTGLASFFGGKKEEER